MKNPGFDDEPRAPLEPLRLYLLGGIDLRDRSGAEISAVLAQPKRFALLAYLAAAPGARFRRRDQLLGVFWPDADEARARGSLNRSLSFLRGWLGNDVIVSRGKDEVGIAADHLWSDVAAFEAAISASDLAAAVDLCRGDLLEGFHVGGTAEFSHWIDRERARLRMRACTAAWALAARAEEAGNMEDALVRARRALELDLLDEPALRRLLALLDRTGDRLGAARVYADFVRLLDREFEMEPSPETRALMETVRSRVRAHATASTDIELAGQQPQPDSSLQQSAPARESPTQEAQPQEAQQQHVVPAHTSARTQQDGDTGGMQSGKPGGGFRPVRVAGALVVLVLLILAALQITGTFTSDSSAPNASNTVLVLPFSHTGDADVAFLKDGAAEILSANLVVPGELATIDARAVREYLDGSVVDAAATDRLRELGEHFRARYFVTGGVTALSGQLHIHAALIDTRNGQRLADVTLRGTTDEAFALFDDLTRQMLIALPATSKARLSRAAARSTTVLPALRAYLEGEQHYREGRFAAALDAYRTAITEDSTFALALYRFDVTGDWTGTVTAELSKEIVARALRHSARLAEPERMLIEAWAAYRSNDLPEADILYTRIVRGQPNNLEAWYRLGELRFHWGTWFGRSYRLAREAFEHVRRFNPNDVPALIHLARIAAADGDQRRLDTLIAELHLYNSDDRITGQAELLRAYAFGNQQAKRDAFAQATAHGPHRIFDAAKLLAAHTTDLRGAAELAAEFTEQGPPALENVVDALALQALIELGRGRPESAHQLFSRVVSTAPADFRALALVQPWVSADPKEVDALRRQLAAFPGPDPRWNIGGFLPRRVILEGLLAVQANDTIAARGFIRQLKEARTIQPRHIETTKYLGRVLEAALLRAQGNPDAALDALGSTVVIEDITPTAHSYSFAYARFLRAMLLEESGQYEEALKWYATFPEPEGFEVVYRAPAHLAQGRIELKLGRKDRAAAHFATAAILWQDAEPQVAALLETNGIRR